MDISKEMEKAIENIMEDVQGFTYNEYKEIEYQVWQNVKRLAVIPETKE